MVSLFPASSRVCNPYLLFLLDFARQENCSLHSTYSFSEK
ncbi:hypothetical protein MANES_09G130901v8 [Manihot esculenta]|uniref:Uncharacterized protein n=1 Tax=Manihot esculenta TaxID=3983 RepID=A0ACB7H7I4_MANES|nr:hypothetical protein MANES_09G130901v8 [Manihot esculenta]